jgi:hypothetical protein
MKKFIIGILTVILAFSSACIYIGQPQQEEGNSNPEPVTKQPVAYIDSISPATAFTGDTVTFTGHGTDANGNIIGYEWQSDIDGVVSTIASFSSDSLSPGTHTVSFRVLDNENLWSANKTDTITIKEKIAVPVIDSFIAVPGNIVHGSATELQWNVSNADTVSIDNGVGNVPVKCSLIQYPDASTTYTLTATSGDGSVIATAYVNVDQTTYPGNPVIEFDAEYLGGSSWKLEWTVLYATEIEIQPGIGTVDPTGSTVVTVPSGSTTYRLNATNDWGWAYWDVTLFSP